MKSSVRTGFSLLAVAVIPSVSRAGLTFNFISGPGITPAAYNGFVEAGNRWSSLFSDNVTLNINIDYQPLGAGILGQAGSADYIADYSTYKFFMNADKTSAADATALANLPAGASLNGLMNVTTQNGGSFTPYLDNNNSHNNQFFVSSSAQLKALGALPPSAAIDASIEFSSNFNFDFDPSNGITSGFYDFVGVATHEIGHAMGFFSDIDSREYAITQLGPQSEDAGLVQTSVDPAPKQYASTESSVMDMFRFSAPTLRDWTVGSASQYFSIDNGVTPIAPFSTGSAYGDGNQASHWKDLSTPIGIMDPTAGPGELLSISPTDVEMLDVLGWDRATAVPEAGTLWAGLAFASLGMVEVRRRQRALATSSAKI